MTPQLWGIVGFILLIVFVIWTIAAATPTEGEEDELRRQQQLEAMRADRRAPGQPPNDRRGSK